MQGIYTHFLKDFSKNLGQMMISNIKIDRRIQFLKLIYHLRHCIIWIFFQYFRLIFKHNIHFLISLNKFFNNCCVKFINLLFSNQFKWSSYHTICLLKCLEIWCILLLCQLLQFFKKFKKFSIYRSFRVFLKTVYNG
jgi:hypothetical protein